MSEMEDGLARLERLERRVQQLEDEAAVRQLVSSYGPLVDSGSAEDVAALWHAEGAYDYQTDVAPLEGREALRAMVQSRAHQRFLREGCGHVVTTPWVQVDGDDAVATCYSLLVRRRDDSGTDDDGDREGEGWRVARLSANRWELQRVEGGWQVTRRTNRLLDGRADGRELLARGAASEGGGHG